MERQLIQAGLIGCGFLAVYSGSEVMVIQQHAVVWVALGFLLILFGAPIAHGLTSHSPAARLPRSLSLDVLAIAALLFGAYAAFKLLEFGAAHLTPAVRTPGTPELFAAGQLLVCATVFLVLAATPAETPNLGPTTARPAELVRAVLALSALALTLIPVTWFVAVTSSMRSSVRADEFSFYGSALILGCVFVSGMILVFRAGLARLLLRGIREAPFRWPPRRTLLEVGFGLTGVHLAIHHGHEVLLQWWTPQPTASSNLAAARFVPGQLTTKLLEMFGAGSGVMLVILARALAGWFVRGTAARSRRR